MITEDKEQARMVDVIMYVVSLSQSAFRFAKGQPPFDFEDTATAEYLMARNLPFIENEDVDYKVAHQAFIQNMVENGWKKGPENFSTRTHPDIVSWDQLSKESKEMYGYSAAMVCSAKGFYKSLKEDLESEFMSSFDKPALFIASRKLCQCTERTQ